MEWIKTGKGYPKETRQIVVKMKDGRKAFFYYTGSTESKISLNSQYEFFLDETELAAQFSNQVGWVKASERLPEIMNKPIPAKLDNQYGVLTRFETHIEFSGRGFFQSFHHKETEDFKRLLWLNEKEEI